jgi:hypothetical protein
MLILVVIQATDQATLGQYFFGYCSFQAGFGRRKDVMVAQVRRFACQPLWHPEL